MLNVDSVVTKNKTKARFCVVLEISISEFLFTLLKQFMRYKIFFCLTNPVDLYLQFQFYQLNIEF